jgi:DNA helicase HerA-like ATPase
LQQTSNNITLGRSIGKYDHGEPFNIDPSWLTRSAVIVGKAGTGKSHDIDFISRQLGQEGCSVVVLDWTGEHAEALAGLPCANVLMPGKDFRLSLLAREETGLDADEAVLAALEAVSHYLSVSFLDDRLTPSQRNILKDSLRFLYGRLGKEGEAPTVSELLATIQAYEEVKKGFHGLVESCESLISRLGPLTVGRMGAVFDARQGVETAEMLKPGVWVVDLSVLRYDHAKNLVSQLIANRLFHGVKRFGTTDRLRQLIIVDEAHHIAPDIPRYVSIPDQIAMENRKYGQGILAATTSPAQLSRNLMRNVSLRITHMLDDGEDIDLMLRFMVNKHEMDRFISDFMLLEIGEAMVRVSTPVQVGPTKVKIAT